MKHSEANNYVIRTQRRNPKLLIEDDKLPDDMVRNKSSDMRHALSCLECDFKCELDPTVPGSIGGPLYVLLEHRCKKYEGSAVFSEASY